MEKQEQDLGYMVNEFIDIPPHYSQPNQPKSKQKILQVEDLVENSRHFHQSNNNQMI